MRRRQAVAALLTGTLLALGLMAVFAVELTANQSQSQQSLESQARARAELVSSLVDTIFAQSSRVSGAALADYSALHPTRAAMDRNRRTNEYVALFDAAGHLIATSSGVTAQARAELTPQHSGALHLILTGPPWALGNILPYGRSSVINIATRLNTPHGTRYVLSGIPTSAMSAFLLAELRQIPAVKNEYHSLVDGHGTIIASTNPARPTGYRLHSATQLRALDSQSGIASGRYFDQIKLPNTTWGLFVSAPTSTFFASVSGVRHWLPWAIFAAFGLVALTALGLAIRTARAGVALTDAHVRLEQTYGQLGAAHEALADTHLALEHSNAELERRAQELERSNSELEQFASIASHDLQEPLRKVRTFTERIVETEGDQLSEQGVIYLQRANASAARMQQLIEDLLRYSRVATQGRPFSEVDLGKVSAEVLDDLDDVVTRSGAAVHVGALPVINADPMQMRQLLQNLISNALKFRRADVTPEVHISATVDDGWVRLCVSDNGIGFDPQYARRIFRVFERLHGRGTYPGTGIGLALCRRIAERHGGSVVATSVLGEGSVFTVTLQTRRTEPARNAPEPSPSTSRPARPGESVAQDTQPVQELHATV